MKVPSSEFRKNMFQYIGQALEGGVVQVEYKGRTLRLVPEEKVSLMSRLVKRDAIVGTPDDLEAAQRELSEEMIAAWDAKWDGKL